MPEREPNPDQSNHVNRQPRPRKPNYMARRLTAVLAALSIAAPIDVATGNPAGKVFGAIEHASGVEGPSPRQTLENLLPQGDDAHLLGADVRLDPNRITLRNDPSIPSAGEPMNVSSITQTVELSKPAILEEGIDADGVAYMKIGGFVGKTAVFAEINPSTLPGVLIKQDGSVEWMPANRDINQFVSTTPQIEGLVTTTHFDGDAPSIELQSGDSGSVITNAASGQIIG